MAPFRDHPSNEAVGSNISFTLCNNDTRKRDNESAVFSSQTASDHNLLQRRRLYVHANGYEYLAFQKYT